jgi:hypothetical protein
MGQTLETEPREHAVESDVFAQYAESDVTRWRQVVGCCVVPVDSRWGNGVVRSVSWGSLYEGVAPSVQIVIHYEAGWTVTTRAASWAEHHQRVFVPHAVAASVQACIDPSLSEEERSERLREHALALRQKQDRIRLRRVSELRQRILQQRETD